MNLVKWFRKNNKKVMAVVVIVIMFGFIGGGTLLQQLSRRATGLHKTIAYFGDNIKITNNDLYLARQELDILDPDKIPVYLDPKNRPADALIQKGVDPQLSLALILMQSQLLD